MKSVSLGVLTKVLYILLSWIYLSEAKVVSNAVCKWNTSLSTCQQDQQGLIDLLTQAGQAHTFSLLMRCQYASYKSQCNNLSKDTCIWQNGACHISSKKLVTQINSCFNTHTQQVRIIRCKNELVSIANSTTWINQHSLNPASSCRQVVGSFKFYNNTCSLMEYALECGRRFSGGACVKASSISNQAYQFVSDLRYVMNVSQQAVSLSFQYLERELDIRAENLEEYFRCSQQDQQECEEPPPPRTYYSRRQKNNATSLSFGVYFGIVIGVLIVVVLCSTLLKRMNARRQAQNLALGQINGTRMNERRQAQNRVELGQINVSSQNTAQNQIAAIETADIIGALPSIEFMGAGENRSEQVCVICLEGLKEGEVSTVLPCVHWFHKKCMESWINNKGSNVTCPLCKHPIQQQNHN